MRSSQRRERYTSVNVAGRLPESRARGRDAPAEAPLGRAAAAQNFRADRQVFGQAIADLFAQLILKKEAAVDEAFTDLSDTGITLAH